MIVALAHRNKLAATVRRVRAEHEAAGSPALPELDQIWTRLETSLETSVALGDNAGVQSALDRYETDALQLIRAAAND